MHAPTEDKRDDIKANFHEELRVEKFPNDHMKMLLNLKARAGRTCIFILTIGNKSLHETSNDNGARVVEFTSKYP